MFKGVDKAHVIQEARAFNDPNVDSGRCIQIMTKLLYLLGKGENFRYISSPVPIGEEQRRWGKRFICESSYERKEGFVGGKGDFGADVEAYQGKQRSGQLAAALVAAPWKLEEKRVRTNGLNGLPPVCG